MESHSALRSGCQPGKRKTCAAVVILGVIIGSILLAYTAFAETPKDLSLKKVFIIFRHGDRNPTETYPNDPYRSYEWSGGWGGLTKQGMLQMYTLGQWIRKEFGWMTDYKYDSLSTMVNSSAADRCIVSAQALVAGLYPPTESETFVPGLPWKPIPVHYVPKYLDEILTDGKPCPKLTAELAQAYKNESVKSDDELESYYQELKNITGQSINTITDVEFLYNTLEIEVLHGLKLPENISKFYNDKMRKLAARSFALFTSNTLQQRLRGGPVLKHILKEMKLDSSTPKMYLYSTHDKIIINILRSMGFTDELFKLDFGATLIFELRSSPVEQSQEVRVSFLNNTQKIIPHKLKIPGCKTTCLLDDLYDVWKDVIPYDRSLECNL